MFNKRSATLLTAGLVFAAVGLYLVAADRETHQQQRERLTKAHADGNFKVAHDGLRKLALDRTNDPKLVGGDYDLAVTCLQSLGRASEIDDFREAVVAAWPQNWRLLHRAAASFGRIERYGYIVAGRFQRGARRGGGRYVSSLERDRARAMQLYLQGLPLAAKDVDKDVAAQYHKDFSDMVLNGAGPREAWRLQYLTDLATLPDYEDSYPYYRWRGNVSSGRGAPVDDQNRPLYYRVPKSFAAAANDGERWRWLLTMTAELAPARTSEVDYALASFCQSQFGVQTMGWGWRKPAEEAGEKKTGTFDLHTLKDTETIAKLATGVQRFDLPDEFNYIKIFQRIAGRGKGSYGEHSRDHLAGEFEDRRQYVKAAEAWRKAIAEYGPGTNNHRQTRLDQIVKNWGRFEASSTQPAGKKAVVDYRFRNGKKVEFEAFAVKVDALLTDVKAYFKSNPRFIDWQQQNITDVGSRLVWNNQTKYIGAKVAGWTEDLKPRPEHVDERVTVTTPLDRPGAYLLTGKMENGNVTRVLVWLADTSIVKKQLEGKSFYYVADAVTGKPIEKANVEFFGWKHVYVQPNSFHVDTMALSRQSDADGQVILTAPELPAGLNWMIVARKANEPEVPATGGVRHDRFAYLGFSGVWYNRIHDPEYHQIKTLVMTDRPVYRPENKVHFKAWVRHAKYDQGDTSDHANQSINVIIRNPKNEKVYENNLTTDAYAGLEGEWPLPKDATLGTYTVQVNNNWAVGHFRVEEYKKPEFEVKVEAPKEPIRLGEKIEATIQARYYFGAPVAHGKVKYKVTRNSYDSHWYPCGAWDWFYGTGYWWFASDYLWYPGWREWGCFRPVARWWGGWHRDPPEIVLENEVALGADGIVKITIDTAAAKELHPDQDHKYSITAEVVDESRRTIVGTGDVLVSRKPFQVFAWVDRGHYRVGDTVKAGFSALTLDRKPVTGTGELTLYQVRYGKDNKPVERPVQTWNLDTDAEGKLNHQLKAAQAGQYRLSYKLTDAKKHTIEGGYVFVVRGAGFEGGKDFRFNDLELITDKREYQPGDTVKLLINTDQTDGTVLLFVRPTNGVYLPPRVVRIKGKSTVEEIAVVKKDMPNFFVEALTVHGGRVHSEVREVVVPPEKRVLNVEVLPSLPEYKPGQKATVKVRLTDFFGKPFIGSTVLTVYDRSVEYISGGSNVPEIKEFFWKWRRHHYPQTEASLSRSSGQLLKQHEIGMGDLGMFGAAVIDEMYASKGAGPPGPPGAAPAAGLGGGFGRGGGRRMLEQAKKPTSQTVGDALASARDGAEGNGEFFRKEAEGKDKAPGEPGAPPAPGLEPTVRKNFADTAFWKGSLNTDKDGMAEVTFSMPEQLTGWKIKVWGLGHGTKVGQGEIEVTTKKNLLLRLQSPRFFVQKDEVVLSANVHNYLKKDKDVAVSLEVEGRTLELSGSPLQKVKIAAGGEKRVDWRVKVKAEGPTIVRMKAVTDEESDAMQMSFPAYVHGMLKMDSFSGVIRPEKESGKITISVPAERRINETRLEVRFTPTLAGAMVDALPYLVEYPYGCTEQTLNRFLPTVITQRTLQRMKLDLKDIQQKRTNLNAAEIGDDKERAKGWKRFDRNPVFDEAEVTKMTSAGVQALTNMQCSDGGWGWFSGWGEHSWPHTTAVVVHGFQIARENDVVVQPNVLQRGVDWLKGYQAQQIQLLNNAPTMTIPYKEHADNLDAFVNMVLVDAGVNSNEMRDYLYRDRTHLGVYAKALLGLALHKQKEAQKLAMVLQNIEQFVVEDKENQTAYLQLPAGNPWWYWYGSETEANAYYLKLLSATNAKDPKAAGLVKYLLNNRKHATYWNSTRDTALCIEAMADYLKASGEDKPDLTVEVLVDGRKHKEVKIDTSNLFTFDNKLVLLGDAVDTGKHVVEIRKKGTGPVYFNAYLTNFTLEDNITRAGLEVKVNRKYYKLERIADAKTKVSGSRGQATDQKVEKYRRIEMQNLDKLKSGDLVEIELEIDSKNDYEYLLFEDMKASGCEPMMVRSGYNPNDLGAYMEMRDDRVCFFVRRLARGKHSVAYRVRAEIPGQFSALPARASAMYAPELKGNSDEIKIVIED
jgi:uncharacterized protein YfaS (alpha-2-macroglobulin family)